MPGEYDPSNLMLPQQPLHHAMFTRAFASAHKQNLHTATNPYSFSLNVKNVKKEEEEGRGEEKEENKDNILFMGTSGQFIDDIRRSTTLDDPIELMRLTLAAGHLGPTCPGTCVLFF